MVKAHANVYRGPVIFTSCACVLPPQERPRAEGGRVKGGGFAFEADHLELFSQHALKWPPQAEDYTELDLEVQHLPRRQQEAVYFHTHGVRAVSTEDKNEKVVDLNKSLTWQLGHTDASVSPCLVSSSKFWLVKQRRLLVGAEALLLQGWDLDTLLPPQDPHRLREFRETFLHGVAGNAMNAFVLSDLFIGVLSCVDLKRSIALQACCRPLPQPPQSSVQEEKCVIDVEEHDQHCNVHDFICV